MFEQIARPITVMLAALSISIIMLFTGFASAAEASPDPIATAQILSFTDEGASRFAGTVRSIVGQDGQPDYELAKDAARAYALNALLPAVPCVIGMLFAIYLCHVFLAKLRTINPYYAGDYHFCIGLAGIVAAVLFILSGVYLTNAWAWVGVFHPEVYMVKMALEVLR